MGTKAELSPLEAPVERIEQRPTERQQLQCPECGKLYGHPNGLGRHRQVAHGISGTSHSVLNRNNRLQQARKQQRSQQPHERQPQHHQSHKLPKINHRVAAAVAASLKKSYDKTIATVDIQPRGKFVYCPECEADGLSVRFLKRRMLAGHRKVHGVSGTTYLKRRTAGRRPFQCTLCSHVFKFQSTLDNHMENKHHQARPHQQEVQRANASITAPTTATAATAAAKRQLAIVPQGTDAEGHIVLTPEQFRLETFSSYAFGHVEEWLTSRSRASQVSVTDATRVLARLLQGGAIR